MKSGSIWKCYNLSRQWVLWWHVWEQVSRNKWEWGRTRCPSPWPSFAVAVQQKGRLKLCRETAWKEPEGPKHVVVERNVRKRGKTWHVCKTSSCGSHCNYHKRGQNGSREPADISSSPIPHLYQIRWNNVRTAFFPQFYFWCGAVFIGLFTVTLYKGNATSTSPPPGGKER